MLLEELFQRLPEDYGSLPNANIPSFDPRYSKVVGKFDGYDIWGSREIPNRDTFGIRDSDGSVLSLCGIESNVVSGTHKLMELWTAPSQRGRGLATILLLFLMRKIQIKLLLAHDEILSADARLIILKGLTAGKFKATNTEHELLSIDQIQSMFSVVTLTKFSVILTESKTQLEVFSDSRGNGDLAQWHFVRGMNQDLD